MLTVWGRANSINVQKVLWALVEVDVAFERIDAGMQFGGTKTSEYVAMNPNALVPTIDDDGFTLWESNVIVRYLATTYGRGALCPHDLRERFLAEKWMDWQMSTFYPAIAPAFLGLIRKVPDYTDPAVIDAARARTEACVAILDDHLANRAYLNGERFTMADIPAGATADRWFKLPVERRPRPNVERWLGRLAERPGFITYVSPPLS